jgi:endoglucanase
MNTKFLTLPGLIVALFVIFVPFSSNATEVAENIQICRSVSQLACETSHSLGRGINMGAMLEAQYEGAWGLRLDPAYVPVVASKFTNVRIPVRWSNHAATTADAKLDEFFAKRVDGVIDSFLERGMYVVLDMHHYSQLFGEPVQPNEFEVDPDVVEARFINMWRQIALRYKDRSPKLIFDLLNEPHGRLNGDPWNKLLAKTLKVVRESNPNRLVLIGPSDWNAARELPKLVLPADRNLIVTIHNYDPFFFTHQGMRYLPMKMPTGVGCCDAAQQGLLVSALNLARKWSIENGYPIYVGEFGSYVAADMESRERYTRFARNEFEKRGFSWAYWEFASSFGVYDPKARAWIEPIRRALLD